MSKHPFRYLWKKVQEDPTERSLSDLAAMAASRDSDERLSALIAMRKQIDDGHSPADYFDMARLLIADKRNRCRWQALIVVSESIETNPEAVWQVVCTFAVSKNEDMRTGVAVVLLEHLLEYHFDFSLARLKEVLNNLSKKNALRFTDTLGQCWVSGQAKNRWEEVEALTQKRKQDAKQEMADEKTTSTDNGRHRQESNLPNAKRSA